MAGKGSILEYRCKLDATLASPDLMNDELVHTLVKNQMLQSCGDFTEYVVERRTEEVSNFLSMLRSASAHDTDKSKAKDELRSGWKIKQDTEEFRVMYREGPEGSPFHTLLAEGYVDGSVDVCVCISCESDLYKKWWPQTAFPPFKVLASHCVKRIRAGEQIALVRMKVPWPLSSREALVHYFTFEYFKDGLVVVLLNSISDVKIVDRSTHGFTRDGIPDAEDVVRIDVVGGFAIQKVGQDRSYFRTIANMDIKLDFVPPAFINFVARQLVGSGFRLYKKEVATVSKGDQNINFLEALKDPQYHNIRKAIYSQDSYTAPPALEKPSSANIMVEEPSTEAADGDWTNEENKPSGHVTDPDAKYGDTKVLNEIVEFKETESVEIESIDESIQKPHNKLANEIEEASVDSEIVVSTTDVEPAPRAADETRKRIGLEVSSRGDISPVVREALGTLEKVIYILREYNNRPAGIDEPCVKEGPPVGLEVSGKDSILSVADQIREVNGTCGESSDQTSFEPDNKSRNHSSSAEDSKLSIWETNQSKVVPATPDAHLSGQSLFQHINSNTSSNQRIFSAISEHAEKSNSPRANANGINENSNGTAKKRKKWLSFCCLNLQAAAK